MTERTIRRQQTLNFAACISLESCVGSSVPAVHYIAPRTHVCNSCYAILFKHETKNVCCKKGAVQLPDSWHLPHSYI